MFQVYNIQTKTKKVTFFIFHANIELMLICDTSFDIFSEAPKRQTAPIGNEGCFAALKSDVRSQTPNYKVLEPKAAHEARNHRRVFEFAQRFSSRTAGRENRI